MPGKMLINTLAPCSTSILNSKNIYLLFRILTAQINWNATSIVRMRTKNDAHNHIHNAREKYFSSRKIAHTNESRERSRNWLLVLKCLLCLLISIMDTKSKIQSQSSTWIVWKLFWWKLSRTQFPNQKF